MKQFSTLLKGWTIALTYMTFLTFMFTFSAFNRTYTEMSLKVLPLTGLFLFAFLLDYLLMSRSFPAGAYFAIQFLLCGGGFVLLWKSYSVTPAHPATGVFFGVLYMLGILLCAWMGWEPLKKSVLAGCFDVVVVVLIVTLFIQHTGELFTGGKTVVIGLVSLTCTMLALLTERLHTAETHAAFRGNPGLGRLLLVLAFAVIALLAFLLGSVAMGGAHAVSWGILTVLKGIGGALGAVGTFLFGWFTRFMTWLVSLLPEEHYEEIQVADVGIPNTAGETESAEITVPIWLYAVVIAAALLVIVLFLLSLRKLKMKRKEPAARPAGNVTRQGTLGSALRQLAVVIRDAAVYRVNCVRFRRTPAGLLAWCERQAGRKLRRTPGQSGEQWLLSLADGQQDNSLKDALRQLAALVQQAFYSGKQPVVSDQLYQTIRSKKLWKTTEN